jgi:hypothetical protein
MRERRRINGKRVERVTELFPRYLFVLVEGGRWWGIRWCVGVRNLVA